MMTTWLALKQNQKNAWIGHLIDEGIESGVTALDKKAGYQVLHFHWIKKLCLIFFTFSVTSVQLWQHDSQLLIQNFFNFRFSGEFRHNVGKTFFFFVNLAKRCRFIPVFFVSIQLIKIISCWIVSWLKKPQKWFYFAVSNLGWPKTVKSDILLILFDDDWDENSRFNNHNFVYKTQVAYYAIEQPVIFAFWCMSRGWYGHVTLLGPRHLVRATSPC